MNLKLSTSIILILCLCGSVTFGLTPKGTSTANLEKGKWSIGLDYAKTEIDLKLKNIQGTTLFTTSKVNEFEIESILGRLAHGINDKWEVFAGFGVSEARYKEVRSWIDGVSVETLGIDYESDTGFAAEAGTKVTLYDDDPLKIGALFQVNWATLDGTYAEATWTDGSFNGSGGADLKADIIIYEVAPGVSYEMNDSLIVYGGPFWQWIDGDGSAKGLNGSLAGATGKGDIKEDSSFGGRIGIQANNINIEIQTTSSSRVFGLSFYTEF